MKKVILFFLSIIIFVACHKQFDVDKTTFLTNDIENKSTADTGLPFVITNDSKIVSFINANNGSVLNEESISATYLTQTPLFYKGFLIAFAGKNIIAIDIANKKIIWKTNIDTKSDFSSHAFTSYPCLFNQHIYFIYNNKTVYTLFSLDAITGKVEWSHPLPRTYMNDNYINGGPSGPTCTNNMVIAASNDTLYAYNATSGKEIWRFNTLNVRLIFNPYIYNDIVYFATNTFDFQKRDTLYALSLQDGKLKWKKDVNGLASNPAPICENNRLYINGYNGILCMNARNGVLLWKFTQSETYDFSPLFLSDNKVFMYSSLYEQTQLYALNSETGNKLWQIKTAIGASFNYVGPIVSNNLVLFSSGYHINAYKPEDGSEVWQTKMLDHGNAQWSPVVVDKFGNIAVSSSSGMF